MPLRKIRTSVLVLHTLQQGGITHLAADYISRTPYLLPLLNSILSLEHSNGRYIEITEFKLILAIYHKRVSTVRADSG